MKYGSNDIDQLYFFLHAMSGFSILLTSIDSQGYETIMRIIYE